MNRIGYEIEKERWEEAVAELSRIRTEMMKWPGDIHYPRRDIPERLNQAKTECEMRFKELWAAYEKSRSI